MAWQVADLEHWDKNLNKSKDLQRELNKYIVTERQKRLYLEEKGYFPEEFDWPEWKQGIERSRYVKKLTETNPTHESKRPSRSKKAVTPAKRKWSPH